jgi:hypothetical protein
METRYKYDLGLLDHLLYIKLILLRLNESELIPLHKLSFSNNSVGDILFCLSELSSINKTISFDLMGLDLNRELIEHTIEYFVANSNKYLEDIKNKADFLSNNEELIDKDELQVSISVKDRSRLEEDINNEISNFKMDLLDRGESDKKYYSLQLQEKALSEILLKEYENLKVSKFPISLSEVEDKKIDVLRTLLTMDSNEKIKLHKIWNKRKSWLINSYKNEGNKLQDKDEIYVELELLENIFLKTSIVNEGLNAMRVNDKKLISNFENEKGTITINDNKITLPYGKNEHCFCRVMFNSKVQVPVDWSEVFEEMTGKDFATDNVKTNERSVYDTYLAINNRVKENSNIVQELFTWKDKTIKRNY